jgi:hypothetical protein
MFDDIKELIDQAAPQPNQTHRDELWQQFQNDAQVTTATGSTASRPTTVLRPPAPQPVKPSDTIILETIVPADELAKRRKHRRMYSALAVAAAVLTIAGIAAVSRSGKTVQVSPAAEPSATVANDGATTLAPVVLGPTEAPRTATTLAPAGGSTIVTYAPTLVPATTIAPVTTPAAPTSGATTPPTTVPKTITTVGAPATKLVTIVVPVEGNEPAPGLMRAVGAWDGKNFVELHATPPAGPYQNLNGDKFNLDAEGDWGAPAASSPEFFPGVSFSATPWAAQPRAVRSQGSVDVLKDARFDIYREEARRLAKDLGAADSTPALSAVMRVDLDGDGTEEVLVAASYRKSTAGDLPPAGPKSDVGSFSIAYVRHVAGKSATSKVLSASVAKDAPDNVPELTILGASDINGDGIMEVFGDADFHWEGWHNLYGWNAGSADRDPKVLFLLA